MDSDSEGAPLSRREVLSGAAGGVAAGGVGALLVRDTPASTVGAERPAALTETESGVAESELPYPVWQYHHNRDGNADDLAPASPINVVFPLDDATASDVAATVTGAGWTDSPLEYTLWAWNREIGEYERPDWSGAEAVLGLGGRHHVRAWAVEGTLAFQAHVDSPVVPRHRVTSYAEARSRVEEIFREAGWSVDGTVELENQMPPDHDGEASVIRR